MTHRTLLAALLLIPLLWLGLCAPLTAAEPTGTETATAEGEKELQLPGISEIIPQATELTELAGRQSRQIIYFADLTQSKEIYQVVSDNLQRIEEQMGGIGKPTDWSMFRVKEFRGRFQAEKRRLQRPLKQLRSRIKDLEKLRNDWREKRSYWEAWAEQLQDDRDSPQYQEVISSIKLIKDELGKINSAIEPLVGEQLKLSSLSERAQQNIDSLATIHLSSRGEFFQQNSDSLLDSSFYRSLRIELENFSILRNWGLLLGKKWFWKEKGLLTVLQLLVALLIGALLRKYSQSLQENSEWSPLVEHPWSTGFFIVILAFLAIFPTLPPLLNLAYRTLLLITCGILVLSCLQSRTQRLAVKFMLLVTICTLFLEIVYLPPQMFRTATILICLICLPVLGYLISRNRKHPEERSGLITLMLPVVMVALSCSLLTQLFGYKLLSIFLLTTTIGLCVVLLFAYLSLRIVYGTIGYLLSRKSLQQYNFFRLGSKELETRLKGIFRLLVIYLAIVLPAKWTLTDDPDEDWFALANLKFTLGDDELTLGLVLAALLTLYLSVQISWLLQIILEAEYFPRQNMHRGVRDSIKRLLHYLLILIGGLVALSVMGVEVQKFLVIGGALGIGIGFGLQDLVNNFVSGLILLYERPIKTGDTVLLDGEWGRIRKIGLRATIVETLDRSEIIVPNGKLISEKVVNWTLTDKIARLILPVGVAYGSDVTKVLEILTNAGHEHQHVLEEPPPNAIFVGFGNSSLDFELRVWIKDIDNRLQIRSDLGRYIDEQFRREGVEIPFPQQDLHLRSVDPQAAANLAAPAGKRPPKVDKSSEETENPSN